MARYSFAECWLLEIFLDKFNDLLNLTLQMTVVDAFVGRGKISAPEDYSHLQTEVSSLLNESIALNTSGSVFLSKVFPGFVCSTFIFHHLNIFNIVLLTFKYLLVALLYWCNRLSS